MVLARTDYQDGFQLSHDEWNNICVATNNSTNGIAAATSTDTTTRGGIAAMQTSSQATQSSILSVQQTQSSRATTLATAQSALTSIQNRLTVLENATPPPAVPNVPASLTSGTITNTTIALVATAPVGGATPTGYTFEYAPAGTGAWAPGSSGAGLTGTVTGLTQGTSYDFHCFAFNAAGPGPATPTITRSTTTPFTPSPAWFEIPKNGSTIVMNNGDLVTLVGGVVMLNGAAMGYTSGVILVLVDAAGVIFQENNALGWWFWDPTKAPLPWVPSSDPRIVQPPSGTTTWWTNPGGDGSWWKLPMQTGMNALWDRSSSQVTSLRSGHGSVNVGVNGNANWATPWVRGFATDPLVTVTDQFGHSELLRIPVGTTSANMDIGDNSIGGEDTTRPYVLWAANNAWINAGLNSGGNGQATGAIHPGAGNFINCSYMLIADATGPLMMDSITGIEWQSSDNAFGGITDYDLTAARLNSSYVIQHMLTCLLDISQTSPTPHWPVSIADAQASGTIPEGSLIGIPADVAMPGGLSRGAQLLWHSLQQFGWMPYNDGATGGIRLVVWLIDPANQSLANDIASSLDGLRSYLCLYTGSTSVTNMKGMVSGVRSDAFPAAPLLDYSPTGGAPVLPHTFGAWWGSINNGASSGIFYDTAWGSAPPATTVPPAAARVGYNNRVFFSDFTNANEIATSQYQGWNGTIKWFYGAQSVDGTPVSFTLDTTGTGVVRVFGPGYPGSTLTSIPAWALNNPSATGMPLGQGNWKHGYFELRFRLPGPQTSVNGWPAWWAWGMNALGDDAMGSATQLMAVPHTEWDLFEFFGTNFGYVPGTGSGGVIEWSGPNGTVPDFNPGVFIPQIGTSWHKYGALWTPNRIEFFLDDVSTGGPILVGPGTRWPSMETTSYYFHLGTGANEPFDIDYMGVWQA